MLFAWVAIAVPQLQAAVVVLANQTNQDVALEARLSGGQSGQTTLPPGRLITLPVGDAVEIAFQSGKERRRASLDLNSLYYFVSEGEAVALRPVLFSRSGGVPWMHVDLSGKIPPATVVPVKVLVDEENPAVRNVWETNLRRQMALVSRVFEQYCRVRFEVVATGTWESDNQSKAYNQLFDEFRREVSPEPARLAIGFSSQLAVAAEQQIPAPYQDPLFTHLLVPDAQKGFSDGDQIVLLTHQLGHFLGAVETLDRSSVMSGAFIQDRNKLLKAGVGFDPPNTLAMNLLAEEIRTRDVRSLGEVPRSTRRYLHSIYVHINPNQHSEAFRTAALVYEAPAKPARYTGTWTDGSQASADGVEGWHDTRSQPKLAGKPLFEGGATIRWLLDNTRAPADPPAAAVEMFGGDCLPGRVIGFAAGTESDAMRLAPHLLVQPDMGLDWPEGPPRQSFRVVARWVRRIVWQRATDRYQPGTAFYRDGRKLAFRSVRLASEGIRLLTSDGIREVPLDDLAELHFPALDPWDARFEQLAVLAPDAAARISQIETANGLRATTSSERFQARPRGGANDPNNWYHMVQPAWSIEPLWIPHREVRLRCFFLPHEAPLSAIAAAAERQKSDLGGVWHAQVDRNVEGGPLACGGKDFAWGFGTHAMCELEFPLPASARALRTRLGLDHVIGDGGCVLASIHLGSASAKPLYASPLVIGSTDVLDTGRLELAVKPEGPQRLVLRVDPADKQRPKGADPLDIRDHFDWLEPLVELDPEKLRGELARRGPSLVPAWTDWTLRHDPLRGPLVVSFWDEQTPQADRRYELVVAARGVPLSLSRKLWVTPEKDHLLVAVSRPAQSSPSKIEVRVEGTKADEFEAPVRQGGRAPKPRLVPLGAHAGKQASVEIVQTSPDERAVVVWDAITLVAPPQPEAKGGEKK